MKSLSQTDWKRYVKSGYRIFLGSGAACPHTLINSFLNAIPQFQNLEIIHILTLGEIPWTRPEFKDHLSVNAFFLGPGSRDAVKRGEADYTPCFLSEIPKLFDDGTIPIDVALVQVSPPDKYGYCSFGVSVDIVSSACRNARCVIAQINSAMPRTMGQSFIHEKDITAFIESNEALPVHESLLQDETTLKIGKYVFFID